MEAPLRPSGIEVGMVVEGELFAGGITCAVYKGKYGNEMVAVKKLLLNEFPEKDKRELMEHEVRTLQKFDHKNVISLLGYDLDSLRMVFEYASRGTLALAIKAQEVTLENKGYSIIKGIVKGLQHIHDVGVVHLDIKSYNVLLTEDYTPKIADAGLARHTGNASAITTVAAKFTPAYTPPEGFNLTKSQYLRLTKAADIYGLGMIIWEIASGKQPWIDISSMNIPKYVLKGERPAIPPNCPARVANWICQCWHQNPDKRMPLKELYQEVFEYTKFDELSDRYKRLERKYDLREIELNELKDTRAELEQSLAEQVQKTEAKEVELASKNAQISQLSERVAELEEQLKQKDSEIQSMRSLQDGKDNQYIQFSSELEQYKKLYEMASRELLEYEKHFKNDLLKKQFTNDSIYDAELNRDYRSAVRASIFGRIHTAVDDNNNSLLALVCQDDKDHLARYLISKGVSVNHRNNNKETPLHLACLHRERPAVVEALLRFDADVNLKDKWGRTPLHVACKEGLSNASTAILRKASNIDNTILDEAGNSAFHYALAECNLQTVETFLSKFSDIIDLKSSFDSSALHFAAKNPNPAVLARIIQFFPNVNIRNCVNQTPLHYATAEGLEDNVKQLLEAGGDHNVRDRSNDSPFDIARKRNFPSIMRQLSFSR